MNKKTLHIFTNNYPYKKNDYIFFRDEVKLLEKKIWYNYNVSNA